MNGDGRRERWPNTPAFLVINDQIIEINANSDNGVFLLVSERHPLLPFSLEDLQVCGQFITGRVRCTRPS
jgi:hypothetical protein